MATLPLPDLFLVLTTSGHKIGCRQGLTVPADIDTAATQALLEMHKLAHLPSNTATIDATPNIAIVACRMDSVLTKQLFRVNVTMHACANLDGMSLSDDMLAEAS